MRKPHDAALKSIGFIQTEYVYASDVLKQLESDPSVPRVSRRAFVDDVRRSSTGPTLDFLQSPLLAEGRMVTASASEPSAKPLAWPEARFPALDHVVVGRPPIPVRNV